MLNLNQTELFKSLMSKSIQSSVAGAIQLHLTNNRGVIAPNQIEPELQTLKQKNKSSAMSMVSEAISLFESNGGRIRLFNLSTENAKSPVPVFMPFITAQAPSADGSGNMIPVCYVNMYRIGSWNYDDSQYIGLNPLTDLYSALETGIMAYKIVQEGRSKKVFSNRKICEYLTRIYMNMMCHVITKVMGTTFGIDSFNNDLGKFVISKFFLQYCLQLPEGETTDQLAYAAVKTNRSPLKTLQEYVSNLNIDYKSLTGFLASFGAEFFRGDQINLAEFEHTWLNQYGEGTALTIEYVPYLLHFLFAAFRGSALGGSSKLFMKKKELLSYGLDRLYLEVMNEIRG